MPALLIEGKVDEVAQGAADTALTYEDPVPQFKTLKRVVEVGDFSLQCAVPF